MKIRCIKFINESSEVEEKASAWLTIGKIYYVLSVIYSWSGVLKYRIIGDDQETPALHDARQFETVSSVIPSNWIVISSLDRGFQMMPKSWSRIGFWEEYFDGDSKAVESLGAETKKIIAADP